MMPHSRTEYRRQIAQGFPEDVRSRVPIRHVERIARLDPARQEALWERLRQGKPLVVALNEVESQPLSPLPSPPPSDEVIDFLIHVFPDLDRTFLSSFISTPPLDRLPALYRDLDAIIEELRHIGHGLIALLAILRRAEENIGRLIESQASLQFILLQSSLPSLPNRPAQHLAACIEESHRLLDQHEGREASDRSPRNLVLRLNDILNRKETQT